jgi:hypothetical protein
MNNITIIRYIRLGGSIVIGSDKPMFIVNSKGVRVVRGGDYKVRRTVD